MPVRIGVGANADRAFDANIFVSEEDAPGEDESVFASPRHPL
jgi:hypothetical protein